MSLGKKALSKDVGSIPTAPTITPDDSVALTLLGRVKRGRKSGILFPSCSQIDGVNPLDGTNYLDTVVCWIQIWRGFPA